MKSPAGGLKNIREQGGQGKDKLKITKKQDVFPPVIFQKWYRCYRVVSLYTGNDVKCRHETEAMTENGGTLV